MGKQASRKVIKLANARDRAHWRGVITMAWQKQVQDIFEVGTLLETAQQEIPEGEWLKLVKSELPFNDSTARKLMTIAKTETLRDRSPGNDLPANWTILYELTKLTDEQFAAGIESGAINPKMHRKDVEALRGKATGRKRSRSPSKDPLAACVIDIQNRVNQAIAILNKAQVRNLSEVLTEIAAELRNKQENENG